MHEENSVSWLYDWWGKAQGGHRVFTTPGCVNISQVVAVTFLKVYLTVQVLLTLCVVHFNCFSLVNRLSTPCIIRNICAWFPLIDTFVCKSRLRYWQASVISHSKAWRLMPTLITWPELPSALIKQAFIDLELGLDGGITFDLNWNFIVFLYRRGNFCQVLERSILYIIFTWWKTSE